MGTLLVISEQEKKLVRVVPSERQMRHQKLEFYGFLHFTVNTFTDREWGDGTESPSVFCPEHFDAEQCAETLAASGMRGAILTCKHHDGFCLWPSRYTAHTVAASPFRGGNGDVVREVSEALRKYNLKFGIYLSPWDRHEPCYGKGTQYDDFFVGQLTELLTGYGDIFCVWFDGACGEGPDGNVQSYDWERYYEVIRRLQPEACISVCGPDIRWCGNEAGDTREQEWSVVPGRLRDTEKIRENSQQSDEKEFRQRTLSSSDQDLGSRAVLEGENDLVWYPTEVNFSIRPGWFYHESEDDQVRSLENLISIYDRSVGGNSTMLLNVPPTKEGLIHDRDAERLRELGAYLRRREAHNLVEEAEMTATGSEPGHDAANLRTDEEGSYKTPDGIRSCEIRLTWEEPVKVSMVVIKEDIRFSQRIEKYRITSVCGEERQVLCEGKTVGWRKNAVFEPVTTNEIRVEILESRVAPVIRFLGVY